MKHPKEKAVLTHRVKGGGQHMVVAALRVLVAPSEDGGFFAQGLEIAYVATGETPEIAKDRFAAGLLATIRSYLKRGRPLDGLFFKASTPGQYWQKYMTSANRDELICGTQVDLSEDLPPDVPIKRLEFCSTESLAT